MQAKKSVNFTGEFRRWQEEERTSKIHVHARHAEDTLRERPPSSLVKARVFFWFSFSLSPLKASNLRLNSTNKTLCLINFFALDLSFIPFMAEEIFAAQSAGSKTLFERIIYVCLHHIRKLAPDSGLVETSRPTICYSSLILLRVFIGSYKIINSR